jgi:hypothetical protein
MKAAGQTASGNGRPAPGDVHGASVTIAPAVKRSRLGPFAVVWQFWKDYGELIAHYQTGLLLTVIYYLVAGPTAILARITGHQFLPHLARSAPTFWYDAEMGRPTADPRQYLKQF